MAGVIAGSLKIIKVKNEIKWKKGGETRNYEKYQENRKKQLGVP